MSNPSSVLIFFVRQNSWQLYFNPWHQYLITSVFLGPIAFRIYFVYCILLVGQLVFWSQERQEESVQSSSSDLYVACYTLNMWLPLDCILTGGLCGFDSSITSVSIHQTLNNQSWVHTNYQSRCLRAFQFYFHQLTISSPPCDIQFQEKKVVKFRQN